MGNGETMSDVSGRRITQDQWLGKALAELGFEGDDLTMRSRVFIGFLSGERQIFGANKKAAQRYRKRQLEMLLTE